MNHSYIKLVHSNPKHNDWFVVNWCLGNTCNYKCSYCPSNLHDGSIRWPDSNIVLNFVDKVIEQVTPKKVYFEFTGGEVTLYREFIDVCKHITSKGSKVGLISNGSRTLRWWEENKKYLDHVCLSFHPEFSDAKHLIEVIKILNNDVRTHVNIMMSPEKFNYCFEVANEIKSLQNISMALQPLIHDFGEKLFDYTDEQKSIFQNQHELITKHIKFTKSFDYYRGAMKMINVDGSEQISSAHRFISNKTNDWSGWKCHIGVEQIVVDMSGEIFRGWCKVGSRVGTIYDSTLNIPTNPVICDKKMCHCNFDIMSTKIKNE
jgi:MoaA/NifB/PqqE/SkfB family radical SAM enzyme